jgi:hypothetical protein
MWNGNWDRKHWYNEWGDGHGLTTNGGQSSELVPILVPCTLAVDSRTSMVEVVGILPAMTMNSWHGRDTKNGIDSKGGSSNNAAGDSWQGWDDGKLDDHHNNHFGSSHVSKADSDDWNNFSWDSGFQVEKVAWGVTC